MGKINSLLSSYTETRTHWLATAVTATQEVLQAGGVEAARGFQAAAAVVARLEQSLQVRQISSNH